MIVTHSLKFQLLFALLICLGTLSASGQNSAVINQLEIDARKAQFGIQSSDAGTNFDVKHYWCEWYIDPRVRAIRGKVRTSFKTNSDTASFLLFDFNNAMMVDSVVFRGGKKQGAFQGANLFKVYLGQTLPPQTYDSVSIYYHGVPANSGFGSFTKSSHAGVPIIWTLSCPYSSRDWWPGKQSLTDKADSIDLIITTPMAYRAAGNGKLISETTQDTLKTFHWKHKYPIASYLIATAITNYVNLTHKVKLPSQAVGDSLPVVNFVYPESQTTANTQTKQVLKILSFYDSLLAPYPFINEKYGQAQFGWGGGMEHQTMSFMGNFTFGLQAHELAHQWFGNYITCRSWRDAWLNEGFATYMTAISENRFGTASISSWLTTTQNSVKSNSAGSVWVSDTANINRVFDGRLTYNKGALLLHMLRWTVGETAFWNGVRNYLSDSQLRYGFAKTEQFQYHLEQTSGMNLSGFMADWFTGQGYPTYQVQLTNDGNQMELRLGQTSSHSSVPFFEMKVPIRFSAPGVDTTLIFQHDSSGQIFQFSLPFNPSQVTVDPDRWIICKSLVQIINENQKLVPSQQRFWATPNPFRNFLQINNDSGQSVEVEISNSIGQRVFSDQIKPGPIQNISLEHLPAGFYTLTFSNGHKRFMQKLVKE